MYVSTRHLVSRFFVKHICACGAAAACGRRVMFSLCGFSSFRCLSVVVGGGGACRDQSVFESACCAELMSWGECFPDAFGNSSVSPGKSWCS